MSCHYNENYLEQLTDEGIELGLEGEELENFVQEQYDMRVA